MTARAVVLLALVAAAPAWAGKFPSGLFSPATALEREYRQARQVEPKDPRAAVDA